MEGSYIPSRKMSHFSARARIMLFLPAFTPTVLSHWYISSWWSFTAVVLLKDRYLAMSWKVFVIPTERKDRKLLRGHYRGP